MQKGFNSIVSAGSDGAAKRKAKLFKQSAERAGIIFGEDFLADAAEQRDKLAQVSQGLGSLVGNKNISDEQRSQILSESLQIIAEQDGFTKAFSSVQSLQQASRQQAVQQQRQDVQQDQRVFQNIGSLRKERRGDATTKDTRALQSSFTKIQDAAKKPSAAGDLNLIFNFMKMLDPGSVVREGEFATAQNAAGVPDQVRNLFNRLREGERLNDKQRKDFSMQAQNVLLGQLERQESQDAEFRAIAEENQLPLSQLGIRDEDSVEGAIKKFGLEVDRPAQQLAAQPAAASAPNLDSPEIQSQLQAFSPEQRAQFFQALGIADPNQPNQTADVGDLPSLESL